MVASLYNIEDEKKEIWVYLERDGKTLGNVSLELLARGREMADEMGWSVVGLLLGQEINGLVDDAIAYGADKGWIIDHPLLKEFNIEGYTHAAFEILMAEKPSVLLLGATPNGRDLAGRLAVRLRTGLNADCTGLRIAPENGVLVCEVSGFGGGVLAMIEMQTHRPQMATVRPGVFTPFQPNYDRAGEQAHFEVEILPEIIQTNIIERVTGEGVDLGRAPVLVAGGRGIDGDFQLMRELAELLEGDVGATRPPVDEGHIERERQVGQTGVVCSPRVAICCGISGAFHFVVGVEKADIVIAINSDPDAPIFDYADYCVVGDVHQVVPELIKVLRGEVVYA